VCKCAAPAALLLPHLAASSSGCMCKQLRADELKCCCMCGRIRVGVNICVNIRGCCMSPFSDETDLEKQIKRGGGDIFH
jgi:hypothetical protein